MGGRNLLAWCHLLYWCCLLGSYWSGLLQHFVLVGPKLLEWGIRLLPEKQNAVMFSPRVGSKQATILPSMHQQIGNPMHARSPGSKAAAAIFETESARNEPQWLPAQPVLSRQFSPVLPAGSPLPPTISV